MTDLSLVPTRELQDALMSRFDHAVFYGQMERPVDGNKGHYIKSWGQKGDAFRCIGLAFSMMCMCQNEVIAAETDAQAEDL